eukprot:397007-Pleurochrysis_carterae.AAC.1
MRRSARPTFGHLCSVFHDAYTCKAALSYPHIHPHPHGESAEFAAHRLRAVVEFEMATARVCANPDYETVPCSMVVDSVAAEVDAASDADPPP